MHTRVCYGTWLRATTTKTALLTGMSSMIPTPILSEQKQW
jgi:hypothetical protein